MQIRTFWSPAGEYERYRSLLLNKFKNIHNEVTLLIILMKILTFWSPAGEYERCRRLLLKKFKNINNQVPL